MKTGDKIAKLRREKNLTQEQLAQIMNVSRQSISKWESNMSYPETDKLIQLGKVFDCSMDYLLNEDITEPRNTQNVDMNNLKISFGRIRFEYKSKRTFLGLPLIHICAGYHKPAKGVIAVGIRAKGIVSIGLLSMGVFSFGLLSMGMLSFGLFSLGVLAFGTIAAGVIAFGAIAIGIVAIGGASIGLFSCGGYANGYYVAIGDTAIGKIGIGKTHTNAQIAINKYWETAGYKLFDHSGNSVMITKEDVCTIIDQNVPAGWNFFKNIIKLFVI